MAPLGKVDAAGLTIVDDRVSCMLELAVSGVNSKYHFPRVKPPSVACVLSQFESPGPIFKSPSVKLFVWFLVGSKTAKFLEGVSVFLSPAAQAAPLP